MTSFEERIKKFNRFYLWLVIAVFTLFGAAIVTAVYANVLLGVTIGICAASAYILLLSNELKRALGLSHSRVDGGLSVCATAPSVGSDIQRDERRIPDRLLWLDVVELSHPDEKIRPYTEVKTLFIPRSVMRIKESFFEAVPSLTAIRYLGSAEEWEAVSREGVPEGITVIFENQNEEQGNNENEAS